MPHNPNCDNIRCFLERGEVRMLPTGGGANAILCYTCFVHEIIWRMDRNKQLEAHVQYDLPRWEDLKVVTHS